MDNPKVDKESLLAIKADKDKAVKTNQIVIKDGKANNTGTTKR